MSAFEVKEVKIFFVIMDKLLRKQILSGIVNLFILFFVVLAFINLLIWGWMGVGKVLGSFFAIFLIGAIIESSTNSISNTFEKIFFSSFINDSLNLGLSQNSGAFFDRFKKKPEPTVGELQIIREIQQIAKEQKKTADLVPELLKLIYDLTLTVGLTYSVTNDHYDESSKFLKTLSEDSEKQSRLQKQKLQALETLINSYDGKIAQSVLEVMARYERRFKNGLLDEILGETSSGNEYARSETYEREKFADQVKEQERDLDQRSFKLEVKEELQEQRSTVQDVRTEMVRSFTAHEMKFVEMGATFTEKLSGMAEKISSFREYLVEKIYSLDKRITEETTGIKSVITTLKNLLGSTNSKMQ